MRTKTKTIIITSLVFCTLCIILAHYQFFSTRDQIIELYSQRQLVLTRHISRDISELIRDKVRALTVLSGLISETPEKAEKYCDIFQDRCGLSNLLILDHKNRQMPERFESLTDAQLEVFAQSVSLVQNNNEVQILAVQDHNPQQTHLLLMTPLIMDDTGLPHTDVLIGFLELNKTIEELVNPVFNGRESYLIVIDEKGKILYHPYQPNNVSTALHHGDPNCMNCHQNFDLKESFLQMDEGWQAKECQFDQKKLLSFTHIEINNLEWVLLVNSPFSEITEANSRQFWNFFILTFTMVLIVIAGSVVLFRIRRQQADIQQERILMATRERMLETLQEAEAKYRALVEQAPDAIALYQRQKFVLVNQQFEKLFGIDLDVLNNNKDNFLRLLHPDARESFRSELLSFARSREHMRGISTHGQTIAGKKLDLEISMTRLLLNGRISYQIIIHDVTNLKEAERESSRKAHLAFIGEMSARIAHEIKNPLASLQAGIQLLESNIAGEDDSTREYFKRLTGEVSRVDRIVKGLLSYAREEQLSLSRNDLCAVIENVVTLMKPTVKDKQIEWHFGKPDFECEFKFDAQRIEQVIWNLLINASQSIKTAGNIRIKIEKNGHKFIAWIQDDGNGIRPEIMPNLFKPFFSTKSQGSGLGLAICKKIISAHNGSIKIDSNYGEGTTVKFSLDSRIS